MKKRFILVRHLTTSWNRERRIQGQTDIELDEGGKNEARLLAKKLKNFDINYIISSDLKRASQTAKIINTALKVPITLDKRLRECTFGKVEGLTRDGAKAKYGDDILKAWDDEYDSYNFCEYGGENRTQVLERHLSLLKDCSHINYGKVILFVGHGRGLNTLLASLDYPPNIKRNEFCIIEY